MSHRFILAHQSARQRAREAISDAPDGHVVTIKPPTRSLEQNAAQWPILGAFARQLQWPVNGQMTHMEPEDWKDVLSAAFRRETARLVPGLDGGIVMLGMRTSKMGKAVFSEWLDFLHATAAARGVEIGSEPA